MWLENSHISLAPGGHRGRRPDCQPHTGSAMLMHLWEATLPPRDHPPHALDVLEHLNVATLL